jgi:endonuclease-3
MNPLTEQQSRVLSIYQRLLSFFGIPQWRKPLSPIDELVSTILSQNTNDANRDRAYSALRKDFSTWEEVRDAGLPDVIAAIRPAGLANQKGPRIQKILQEITAERGKLSLDFLQELPTDQALAWLLKFKGIGPKTASIVLLFALDKPAFPVDTHIHRVTRRIGLIPAKMNAEQAHERLAKLFQSHQYQIAHLNLIRLGREMCHARKPECWRCPINDLCDYYLSSQQ